jgi:hypothetical protein
VSAVEIRRKRFKHHGISYVAVFKKRPFREGLEVSVTLPSGSVLSVGELGLGEKALIEKLKAEIDRAAEKR